MAARSRRAAVACAVAACLLAAAPGCGGRGAAPGGRHARHDVVIRRVAFEPASLPVAAGDTVLWHNDDLVPHTVTAVDGRWDSGNLAPDSSWRFVVPAAESLPYRCRYHPTMHGVLSVTGRPRRTPA